MNNNSKLLPAILIIGIFALGIGIPVFFIAKEIYQVEPQDEINIGGELNEPRDVYGTRSSTSTTATAAGSFLNPADAGHTTTSKAMLLDSMTDTALIAFKAIDASSTSFFQYEIYGSNDNGCDSIATSSDDDNWSVSDPFVQDVNWYDIGASNTRLDGLVSNPNTNNASGTVEVLTDLCWKCLKVDLKGASSTVWVQLTEKIKY